MKNNELLPFSRNRYYKGKMLTSADFTSEQRYLNGKRQFVNRMITGSGIVCGLSVTSLDDQSIMVESGVAIDGMGREIVVGSSVVKKLSAIEGFESLESGRACLCIRYLETETQPVYAIGGQDSDREFEYNRIEDGYGLFLIDASKLGETLQPETEFYTGGLLFEDQDYRVQLRIPRYVCAGHYVKLEIEAEKVSGADAVLTFRAVLQTPAFLSPEGRRELAVSLEGVQPETGGRTVREYWMLAQTEACEETDIMIKAGSAGVSVNGVECPLRDGLFWQVHILEIAPELLAAREMSRVNLELRAAGADTGWIRLADIALVRTETAYLIEKTDEAVREYIPTIADAWRRREYAGCFFRRFSFLEAAATPREGAAGKKEEERRLAETQGIATGIVEIPIGDHARKGDICYSDEIMHGLGAGNVYVEVGYEYLEENALTEQTERATIYGDPDLFDSAGQKVAADTAVKVFHEKGSFAVGLRLRAAIDMIVLTFRWVAVRCDNGGAAEEIDTDDSQAISAVTPTVILGVRERYFFQVEYHNMKPCSVTYALTDFDSGEISADGIYTAPAKEGVYEIRISCTDRPAIHTYAYAIVKRKAAGETQAESAAPAGRKG